MDKVEPAAFASIIIGIIALIRPLLELVVLILLAKYLIIQLRKEK